MVTILYCASCLFDRQGQGAGNSSGQPPPPDRLSRSVKLRSQGAGSAFSSLLRVSAPAILGEGRLTIPSPRQGQGEDSNSFSWITESHCQDPFLLAPQQGSISILFLP